METVNIYRFWKSDFIGENLDQLVEILKSDAVKGIGSWFVFHDNFIEAQIRERQYLFLMNNVANFGDLQINK